MRPRFYPPLPRWHLLRASLVCLVIGGMLVTCALQGAPVREFKSDAPASVWRSVRAAMTEAKEHA